MFLFIFFINNFTCKILLRLWPSMITGNLRKLHSCGRRACRALKVYILIIPIFRYFIPASYWLFNRSSSTPMSIIHMLALFLCVSTLWRPIASWILTILLFFYLWLVSLHMLISLFSHLAVLPNIPLLLLRCISILILRHWCSVQFL